MKAVAQPFYQDLKRLLPRGAVAQIATKLGMNPKTVSQALKSGKPGHPAVQRALAMAEKSGALAAARTLARLGSAS